MPRSVKEGGRSSDADAPSPSSDISPPPLISPVPSTPALLESPPAPSPASASRSSPSPLSDVAAPESAPSPDSTPTSTLTGRSPPPPPSSTKTDSPPSPPSLPSNSTPPPPPQTSPPPPRTAQSPPSPSTFTSPPPPLEAKPSLSSSNPPQSPPSSFFSSSTISGASLVGIGLAGTLAFTVLCVLLYCLCRKKKRYHKGDHYNQHGGQSYKDPYYGVDVRHNQEWCSPSSESHMKAFPSNRVLSTKSGYDPVPPPPKGSSASGLGNSKAWFMYHDLANATNGFSKANELGEGGFGCVYKGTLPSGQLIAVKQLKSGASQGEKEFRAEVEIISRVHHRHLVSLVGYCIADRQRLLVYDYVPNGTLEYHLHRKDGCIMDWPTRLKIACGAARGLAYLHEDCHPRIIHRDIKSSNILLDDNFEAQVSDFGLAKLTSDTNTHVTTRVMGTFGYLAPEYASSGKLTDRSDVFSFGVVLLELLTGRKPVDPLQPAGEESLVEWARPILSQVSSDEDLQAIADPGMEGNFDSREVMQMLEAAAACVRHSANKRPRMGQVLRALEDDGSLSDLNKGSKPGQSGVFGSFTGMEYENGSYSADMRKYMRVALDSTQEFGSEGSAATSEYGLNTSMSSGEFHMSKDMGDRTRHLKPTSASTTVSGEHNMSREMRDQSTSLQQQCSKQPLSMRTNMLTYNTQEFRLGS